MEAWETDQGLPQHTVTSITQTQDGFLWLGTMSGLVRFDGVEFQAMDAFPELNVLHVSTDPEDSLWVSTPKGVFHDTRERRGHFVPVEGWTGDFVRSISHKGIQTALTSFNGKVFLGEHDHFRELNNPDKRTRKGYQGLFDSDGHFWVAKTGYIGWWDGETWNESKWSDKVTQDFRGIGKARDGSVWTYTASEFLRISRDQMVERIPVNELVGYSWDLIESSDGSVWITTVERGVYQVTRTGTVIRYTTTPGAHFDTARCVFEDNQSCIWVGSSGYGLRRLRQSPVLSYGIEEGIKSRSVKSIVEWKPGEFLLGAQGGPLTWIKNDTLSELKIPANTNGDEPSSFFVQCSMIDSKGRVWIGTQGRSALCLMDGDYRSMFPDGSNASSVSALFEDKRQRIWIATDRGTYVCNTSAVDINNRPPLTRVPLENVRMFQESSAPNTVWALTPTNLCRLVETQWEVVLDENLIPGVDFRCFAMDRHHSLWIGGSRGELFRWSPTVSGSNALQLLPRVGGLETSAIQSLTFDSFESLWIASDRGIFRIPKESLESTPSEESKFLAVKHLTTADGLPSSECSNFPQSAVCKDRQGRLWFATIKGAAVVDPLPSYYSTPEYQVQITSVSFTDHEDVRHTWTTIISPQMVLPTGTKSLDIHFASSPNTSRDRIEYAYRLQSEQRNWNSLGLKQALSFPNLRPGWLTVEIAVKANGQVKEGRSQKLVFWMAPPFWQTPWFLVPSALLAITGVAYFGWAISQRRLKRQIEELNQQRKLANERAQLSTVLTGTSDFVGFCGPDGNIRYLNEAGRTMVGIGLVEEISHLRLTQFHPEPSQRLLMETGLPTARAQKVWAGETEFLRRDGSRFPASQVIIAHRDAQGVIQFYSTIARDITEQKRIESEIRTLNSSLEERVRLRTAELQALTKQMESFSYTVAHDLRGPLHNIAACASILKSQAQLESDRHRSYLGSIVDQSQKMAMLIDDLLNFATSTQGEVRLSPISLPHTIQAVIELVQTRYPSRDIEWHVPSLPKIYSNEILCHQLFYNLLENAVKYSDPSRKALIAIGVHRQTEREIVVFIRDNGIGFDNQRAEEIFQPFRRIDNANKVEGHGIGLSSAKRALELMGGKIWAESTHGVGTTFFILFAIPQPQSTSQDETHLSV